MVVHIACGKKHPKKKGFYYFLCCGFGNEDDSRVIRKPEVKPDQPVKHSPNKNTGGISGPLK